MTGIQFKNGSGLSEMDRIHISANNLGMNIQTKNNLSFA
jgi:hypothetical protein